MGSIMRYLVGLGVMRFAINHPTAGTFTVNIAGCLIIGLLGGAMESRGLLGNQMKLLIITGFLGGFTTFSSFGFETVRLAQQAHPWLAAAYVLLSMIIGLSSAALGYKIGSLI